MNSYPFNAHKTTAMIQLNIIGNIGKDAAQVVLGGVPYASFTVAVTDRSKGESKTTWIKALKSDREGKLTPYLTKGTKVYLSGHPTISAYISKNTGKPMPDFTIWVNNLELLTSKSEQIQQDGQRAGLDNFPPQQEEDDLPF